MGSFPLLVGTEADQMGKFFQGCSGTSSSHCGDLWIAIL